MAHGNRSRFICCALVAATAAVVGMAPPVHGRSAPGIGTATSNVRAAGIVVDSVEDLSVQLVDLAATATIDKARQNSASNHAEGVLKAAVVDLGPAAANFFPNELGTLRVFRDEDNPGADRRGQNVPVPLQIPGDLAAADVGADNTAVAGLITDINATRESAVPDGLVAAGAIRPLDLEALFTAAGASFTGGSTVDSLEALGGLVKVNGLGVSEQTASATSDLVRGSVDELRADSIKVLGMAELLGLLGVDPGDIPLATLALMADSLGLPVSGTVGSVPAADLGSTWAAGTAALTTAQTDLEARVGGVCTALPGELGGVLGQAGVSCSGTVQQALDALNDVLSQLTQLVDAVVFDASLVSASGVVAGVDAVANVTEDGVAQTSAVASGTIDHLRVGGVDVGAITASRTGSPTAAVQRQWDTVGTAANAQLDEVLGNLGDPYRGLVTVVPVPVSVQNTKIDGDYAVADAALSLLQVRIALPSQLPDPQDLISLLPASPVSPPTSPTSLPVSPTVPTVPTVTVPTLPISSVRPAVGATAVRPQVATLGSATIDIGVLSAHAEHTRPGVGITSGGENLTWNSLTGFGNPGSLPKTGGEGTAQLMVFAVLVATAFGLNRLASAQLERTDR